MNWIKSSEITEPGYYWCRLGSDDKKPSIVLIGRRGVRLYLFEFCMESPQPLDGYDDMWQFSAIADPA